MQPNVEENTTVYEKLNLKIYGLEKPRKNAQKKTQVVTGVEIYYASLWYVFSVNSSCRVIFLLGDFLKDRPSNK